MFFLCCLFGLFFYMGAQTGYIICLRSYIKHLKDQTDTIAQQNRTIAQLQQPKPAESTGESEDTSNYWKPKGWKPDWETGDA